jgi:hypothetical protein
MPGVKMTLKLSRTSTDSPGASCMAMAGTATTSNAAVKASPREGDDMAGMAFSVAPLSRAAVSTGLSMGNDLRTGGGDCSVLALRGDAVAPAQTMVGSAVR